MPCKYHDTADFSQIFNTIGVPISFYVISRNLNQKLSIKILPVPTILGTDSGDFFHFFGARER